MILLLATFAGCGPGNPLGRQAVSGNVTLDGAPLDQGAIEFSPQSADGVSSGGLIKNGAYAIPALKGLPPGKYLVRINSVVEVPTGNASNPADKDSAKDALPIPGAFGGPLRVERIAPAYNQESKIVVEVVRGQEARFDFDVKSQPMRSN